MAWFRPTGVVHHGAFAFAALLQAAEQVIQEAFPDTPRESKVKRKEVGEQKRRLLQQVRAGRFISRIPAAIAFVYRPVAGCFHR